MLSAKKQMADRKRTKVEMEESRPLSNYNFDEAVLKVQEWNEALRCECLACFIVPNTIITCFAHSVLAALKIWWARPIGCRSATGATHLANQTMV